MIYSDSNALATSKIKAKVSILSDSLNVRSKPSDTSKKLGVLKKGTEVKVYAKTKSGWSEIRFKKKKAFVKSKYLITKNSYLMNTKKIYVYDTTYSYSDDHDITIYRFSNKVKNGNSWIVKKNKSSFVINNLENDRGLWEGLSSYSPPPTNDGNYFIKYPVKKNKKWGSGDSQPSIVSTGETIKTLAGTFKNCIVVSLDGGGGYHVYAPYIGLIQADYVGGESTQLVQLKNK